VPFTAHYLNDGTVASVGVKLGDPTLSVDADLDDERTVTMVAGGTAGAVELIFVCSAAPTISGPDIRLGHLGLELSAAPTRVVTKARAAATELRVSFDASPVTVRARMGA
jgi:hypothetical protein